MKVDHERARQNANSILRANSLAPDCACHQCNLARAYLDLRAKAEAYIKADDDFNKCLGSSPSKAFAALRSCLQAPPSRP